MQSKNMMVLHMFFLAMFFLASYNRATAGSSSYKEAFIKKYHVDDSLAQILDKHSKELKKKITHYAAKKNKKHGVWTFSWLPDYYIKYNLDRIYGMELMQCCIEENGLDHLFVPDKRIYHIKGRPDKLNSLNYLIVIKKVEADPLAQPLNEQQAEQLCALMCKTGYISMSRSNYIQTYNNKVALIDTESSFDLKRTLTGLIRLIGWDHDAEKDYTQEAFQHILSHIATTLSDWPYDHNHTYEEVLRHLHNLKGPQAAHYASFFKELWHSTHTVAAP